MKRLPNSLGLKAILLVAGLLTSAVSASSSTFTIPSDDDLIVGARAIITGRVISLGSRLDRNQDRIFTYITVRVEEVLKGRISERQIVLKQAGGQVADRGSVVFGSPEFKTGEQVLLYLGTWPDGSLRVYQMMLGKFSIIIDSQTGERIVTRDLGGINTHIIRAASHAKRGDSAATDRMELSAYAAMVRARLAANWERSEAHEQTYYHDTRLRARPPEYRREAAGGRILPRFSLLPPSNPARWFEPDNNLPVVFFVNPENAPNPEIAEDITAAMNVWSTVAGCSLRVVNGGATNTCTNHNGGLNTIVFNNCDSHFVPDPGCASIIALGGLDWNTIQSRNINGTTFYRAIRGFISFNPYSACNFNDHCKTREVATHELGHALGLGHSQHPDATMFGTAHFDGRCAALRADDINGISYVYPAQDGGSIPLEITSGSTLPGAVINQPYVRVLAARGGSLPYTWSLRPELGRLPQGLTLTSTGVLAGTATVTETVNFTVRVRDGHGETAEKAFSLTIGTTAGPHFDSQFVSQTVPTSLQTGQLFNVTLKWLNSGAQVWDGASGVRLGSQNQPNNTTWGPDRVSLAGFNVTAGQHLEISFTATAPRTAGTYNFQWQLFQEDAGFFGQMSANVAVTVSDVRSPAINGASSLGGVRGAAFSYQFDATGGTPPYTWSIVAGALPPGLTLTPGTGLLAGSPASAGSFAITVQASDSMSRAGQKAMTINVIAPLDLLTSSLPSVVRGAAYAQQFVATGGKPPYSWIVVTGALPAGLGLNQNTGAILGAPTSTGNFTFTVDVTDDDLRSARKALSISVVPVPLSLVPAPAMQTMKGSAFSYQLNATGGSPAYTWSVTGGGLPAGLALNSATGAIGGTPTAAGAFAVTVTVRDQDSQTASTTLQIKVTDPETVPHITRVTYKKSKKKLTVFGERVDADARLRIDGRDLDSRFKGGAFVAKRIVFSRGEHAITIRNSNGETSQVFILTVN
ncbi:MAG TPA: putative Ig domain-containing protein [Blastocatellia bacterium]|nr:putative Ig domain-containing protein [Blastocatellia bacterium]